MGWTVASLIVAAVGTGYGIVSGEQQKSTARKARRGQERAQANALTQQTAAAARSRGREVQRRRGRQLAIASAARGTGIGSPTTPTALDRTAAPTGTAGTSRTLG